MKPGLDPGVGHSIAVLVTLEMCPHFDGVLLHRVYATWSLVHDMEVCGRKLLEPHLEPHEEGIGAHISVDHRAPAHVGETVTLRAVVESCDASRLITRMTAHVGDRLIAEGRFVQAILHRDRLNAMLRPPPG